MEQGNNITERKWKQSTENKNANPTAAILEKVV